MSDEQDELVGVVFQSSWKRWYPGDRAGFTKPVAKKLVYSGTARYAAGPVKRAAEKVKKAVSPSKPDEGKSPDAKATKQQHKKK